jgi:hypothetical protein
MKDTCRILQQDDEVEVSRIAHAAPPKILKLTAKPDPMPAPAGEGGLYTPASVREFFGSMPGDDAAAVLTLL